jgi:hypothetical protein
MPMRQLRTCDFCGDDAAGVYEVLPPELSPTEAEQRRVILCADCAETLETVVDPLLDRLGIDRDGDADSTAASITDDTSRAGSPAADAGATDPGPTDADTSDTDSDSETAAVDDVTRPSEKESPTDPHTRDGSAPSSGRPSPSGPSCGSATPEERGTPNAFGAPDGYTDIAESDEIDLGGSPEDSPPEPEANGVSESESVSDPTEPRDDPAASTAGSDAGTNASAGSGAVGDEPDEFRTVMRLLGNREFPIRRSDVVELAAGAYELEETHVERIIDHAVDRGVLTDEGGTLTRS